MRAGSLDRTIAFERVTTVLDAAGAAVETWTTLATMRARLVSNADNDREREFGASAETWLSFETRWLDGLTLADRLTYRGEAYHLKAVSEIGRRRGLTIKAERIGP